MSSQLVDVNTHAPDSPRPSQSPPPVGLQGDLELELHGLANALYHLGTTVTSDSTKDRDKPAGGKQVGLERTSVQSPHRRGAIHKLVYVSNEVVHHLTTIDDMAQNIRTMIPFKSYKTSTTQGIPCSSPRKGWRGPQPKTNSRMEK
ncbi:hypothetical protein JVT61DRAFT_12727 [Boletus reticuloceps]|uniref:Uncharacterized protein n=1 Tax=Boletus reticuloceps TaxID=495285 RepID=A0A8I3ACI9_9AGAM|nr:hypothetical protein JVT61DRAFT_12727 [Boletus reticuloceps]